MVCQEVKAGQGGPDVSALPPNLSESLFLRLTNKEDSPCLAQRPQPVQGSKEIIHVKTPACYLNTGRHCCEFRELGERGTGDADRNIPFLTSLHPMCLRGHLNGYHVCNYAQLFSFLFFTRKVRHFCWRVCNGSNDATDPCSRGHGTWGHPLTIGQRGCWLFCLL